MMCYLIRHGKDDDSVRGGWSNSPLTSEGRMQVNNLAVKLTSRDDLNIGMIYTSDLLRAIQTADILSVALSAPVTELPEFRESNNGILAGMDNVLAAERYPGLYWSNLSWEQAYPGGESPCKFHERISNAWYAFKKTIQGLDYNVILVTHGGVINVIQCIENGITYSNKSNPFPMGNAEMIGVRV